MYQQSEQWQVSQDMELAVLELSLAYGLTSSLAFRLDIPIVSMNSGFLDPYVNRYHDALGVPSGGPENAFVYSVSKDSQLWLEGESGRVQLADITLSGQWSLLKAHAASGIGWYTTLLGTLKLPTGDARRGYGSGRMDAGVFGPTEWRWLKWSLYLMPGLIFHSDPDLGNVDVGARHSLSIFAGTSYNYNEKWQWLFQCNYFSSPLEHTGIAQIDDGAWEMTFGMRYRLRQHWSYEFGFSEDIFTRAAPDFTVLFSVIWIKEK